ncbi:carbohydrate kinase family protein [Candidatus Saccharibacteria bacterium]|nr:carbohydrate kinase family protein [Candidatus Saccharibacteria bacterium]
MSEAKVAKPKNPSKMKVVCLGAAMQDIFVPNSGAKAIGDFIALPVKMGAKIELPALEMTLGGGAANAAATFAKSDYNTIFWGPVGLDFGSEFVGETLIKENIDITYMDYNERLPTGLSMIFLDKRGERTILMHRGAGARFENLDAKMIANEKPDWLYMAGLGGNFRKIREVMNACQKHGTRIFWNPSGTELKKAAEVKSLLPKIDVFMVNREEAEKVWGERDYLKIFKAASAPNVLIITDACRGSAARQFLPDGEQQFVRAHIYDAKMVDRTGAGDAFGSGFVAHFAAHDDLLKALKFATANSASVVQHVGGRDWVLDINAKLKDLPMVVRKLKRGEQ